MDRSKFNTNMTMTMTMTMTMSRTISMSMLMFRLELRSIQQSLVTGEMEKVQLMKSLACLKVTKRKQHLDFLRKKLDYLIL